MGRLLRTARAEEGTNYAISRFAKQFGDYLKLSLSTMNKNIDFIAGLTILENIFNAVSIVKYPSIDRGLWDFRRGRFKLGFDWINEIDLKDVCESKERVEAILAEGDISFFGGDLTARWSSEYRPYMNSEWLSNSITIAAISAEAKDHCYAAGYKPYCAGGSLFYYCIDERSVDFAADVGGRVVYDGVGNYPEVVLAAFSGIANAIEEKKLDTERALRISRIAPQIALKVFRYDQARRGVNTSQWWALPASDIQAVGLPVNPFSKMEPLRKRWIWFDHYKGHVGDYLLNLNLLRASFKILNGKPVLKEKLYIHHLAPRIKANELGDQNW